MYGERADDEKHLTGIFIKACAVSDLVLVYIFCFILIALFSDSFYFLLLVSLYIEMKGSLLRLEKLSFKKFFTSFNISLLLYLNHFQI